MSCLSQVVLLQQLKGIWGESALLPPADEGPGVYSLLALLGFCAAPGNVTAPGSLGGDRSADTGSIQGLV